MASTQDAEGGITIPLQYNDAHWKSIFEKYDLDGDGKISYHELRAMIRGSAYTNDIPTRVVKMIMHEADLDDSGYLDYPEFIAMIHRKDMQGVFGHYVQRYVHCMVPQRRLASQVSRTSQYSSDTIDGLYEEEYSCNPPAIAMVIISLLEIILFLYDAIAHKALTVEGPAAQLFIYHPEKRKEVWRYVTYMFVHVGIFHLVVNLLVQILLGVPLEMVHRWWRVLTIYLAGVIAGSLGTSVSDPHVLLAGASGGVYALMTAHVATIIMNWSQMEYAILQLLVFVVLAVVDVGQAVYNRYILDVEKQIGYVAHLAGAVAGLLVGINILRNLEVKTWEKVVWWASIVIYIGLMTAAILWNIFRPEYV
ncbi:rhomboid-related protein 2 isoform X2 [Neodiprion pinetum]|nr:rhomboid-related protein 2 isoform X2 [Neodiprion lecontei]XP_015515807.1 rhomboid-related protein 2 isoform X2 [Neodiprion lecontei]XP_046410350.1 rhomboid-related protein 2 isoform X2 [Neodiprion fabricii]XP_046410351.1 rhomboid-related protein 2 isoform X2 [Neodiprion fabricii]XP_046410352.1 rhomboid-related protein 2 isoform X2 [Neodiprion fabricii]XP_046469680.1 rhomboid-related protein 2 isoform X2 [Neodiprion pinetum]XP_046469681.1 rhomboid-related protein 2 isoform X2 [Neodiprion p